MLGLRSDHTIRHIYEGQIECLQWKAIRHLLNVELNDCHPLSAVRSAIRHPPSAIRHPPSAICHPRSAVRHHLNVVLNDLPKKFKLLDFSYIKVEIILSSPNILYFYSCYNISFIYGFTSSDLKMYTRSSECGIKEDGGGESMKIFLPTGPIDRTVIRIDSETLAG